MPHCAKDYFDINPIVAKVSGSLIVLALMLCAPSTVNAINVTNTSDQTTLQNALTGSGVTISNLTVITTPYTGTCGGGGMALGVGTFSQGTTGGPGPVLSEPDGVVISNSDFTNVTNALNSSNNTANNTRAMCANNISDADMVSLESGTATGEYAAIEFDVVPDSTTLAIPFQFGSEEFPEYVCTIYTDIVGIFVSGPGITGPYEGDSLPGTPTLNAENYAKTSAGDLSSINWVNTGVRGQAAGNDTLCTFPNGSFANTAYYTDNSNGNLTGGSAAVALTNSNLEVDGFTNTLFQPITVVAGQTYHVKIAVADTQDRTYDSAAFIHPLFSTGTFSGFDYADAPDTYKTLTSSGGPSHGIDTSIFMGTIPDNEVTGIPTADADGDDLDGSDDEDGVASFPVLLSNATTYSVDVNVTNNTGSDARLVGWIDFDGSGTFESGEGTQTVVADGNTGTTVSLNWSGLSGLVNGDTYARIRFSSDIGLSLFTTGSAMSDGEVEDYTLPISGVTFTKYVSTLDDNCSDTQQSLTVTTGTAVYYCYSVTNPNATPFTITATSDDKGHDISDLEKSGVAYAPGETVVKKLTFTAGGVDLPEGATTVNIASVTANIGGSSVVVNDTASVTVTLAPPASGTKRLYLDGVDAPPGDLTRDPTNALTDTQSAQINGQGGTLILNQGIDFAAPFTITGGTDVDVQLIVLKTRNNATTVQVELFKGLSGDPIGAAASLVVPHARNTWDTMTIPVAIPTDVTLAANDFIRLVITNTTTGNANRRIRVRTVNGAEKSQLLIETGTVINVDSIEIFAETYNLGAADEKYSSYLTDKIAYIRATVSDPFASADITSATITIDSPTSNIVTDATMTAVATPDPDGILGSKKVFEYSYDISTNPEQGLWPISITANEGFEQIISPGVYDIRHTNTSEMIVGTTNIVINKSSSVESDTINLTNPKAIPQSHVRYTIEVLNKGYGYADDDSIVINALIPDGTTLYFGDSPSPYNPVIFTDGDNFLAPVPAQEESGLTYTYSGLATGPDVTFYSDTGCSTVASTPPGTDNYNSLGDKVLCIGIAPKGTFKGTTNPAGLIFPAFSLDYIIRVD